MCNPRLTVAISILALTGASCARPVRYHPQPIAPAASAARLESRRLDAPGLRRFIEKNLGHKLQTWPIQFWTPNQLQLAAYYFNPQIEVARAQAETAQAAVITARERPNPTLAITPGIPAPYLFDLIMNFPLVRSGRREIKIRQARALDEVARFQLAATAWKVHSEFRAAALNYFMAQRRLWIAQTVEALRTQQVGWLEGRLASGEGARPQVEAARLALMNSRTALGAARGHIQETRAALAAAIGVPVAALQGISYSWTSLDNPPEVNKFSPATIQREAVLNRLDVRRSLAEYAAAEAALQLEIARQHPNFSLGPGYQFEESNNYFVLAFSSVLPIFNRNQGPIAEAEARRKEAAARFRATQAAAIAQSEEALASYRAAYATLQDARKSLGQMQAVQEPAARKALAAGETDRLYYNRVLLEGAAVTTTYLDVLSRAQAALGKLEDAVERPLEPGELPPPDFHTAGKKKEAR